MDLQNLLNTIRDNASSTYQDRIPEATRDSMRNLIATQIANGKLDSISKVRELTTIFNSDFNLLSDLFVK